MGDIDLVYEVNMIDIRACITALRDGNSEVALEILLEIDDEYVMEGGYVSEEE